MKETSMTQGPPDGLLYWPDYMDAAGQGALIAAIDSAPWRSDLRRRVQHYGYRYDYKARQARAEDYLGPLPDWLAPLAERLRREGCFEALPDQAIVNEYLPGQGIADHVDCAPCFGAQIVSISLLSPCEMRFRALDGSARWALMMQPGSLLALTGEARYRWTHGIAARKSDLVEGQRQRRGRRVSVTFRKMNLP